MTVESSHKRWTNKKGQTMGMNADLPRAAAKLRHLRQQSESLHYTCQTIEIIALQAMVAHRQGQALDLLEQALALTPPGEWLRPFVERGPPMVELLQQLLKRDLSAGHIRKILAAFRNHQPASTCSQPLVAPLTDRELDVLELLSQRLQNKEISEKLFVSVNTVKSHLKNIGDKLNVDNRRQAVAKATSLGISKGKQPAQW